MTSLIILAAALLPALLLLVYICRQDPQPEPVAWLTKAVCYGVALCVPAILVESAVSMLLFGGEEPTTVFGAAADALLVAAVPEEGLKLLALWLLLRKNPYFDEQFDGIVYAVCVSLGFAAIENVGYLFTYSDEWVSVAVSRALLAVPGHYAFGVFMGYYYSIYHFTDRSPQAAVRILLVPVLAHGIYDAIALSGGLDDTWLSGLTTIVLIYFCTRMHKFARAKVQEQIERDNWNSFFK